MNIKRENKDKALNLIQMWQRNCSGYFSPTVNAMRGSWWNRGGGQGEQVRKIKYKKKKKACFVALWHDCIIFKNKDKSKQQDMNLNENKETLFLRALLRTGGCLDQSRLRC